MSYAQKPAWEIHTRQQGAVKVSGPYFSPSQAVDKMAEWLNHYKARGIPTTCSLVDEKGFPLITVNENIETTTL